jgi:hypothetical protein
MILRIFIAVFFVFAFSVSVRSQQKGEVCAAVVENGDTIPVVYLKPVYIVEIKNFKSKREKRRYTRLVRYVKKVYPYAKLAAAKLQEYDTLLRAADNDRQRKKLMKKAEKELRSQYEGKLRNLTFSQGKILIKLIDRETSYTSYELLKQLRSGLYASIWQGVGKLFGYNLKVKYDPYGADRQIEQIVKLIEAGAI